MAEYIALEVAELIERGIEFLHTQNGRPAVLEKARAFLEFSDDAYRAGVLGLVMIAKIGDPQAALDRWATLANGSPARKLEAAAKVLGISPALARMIELNHRNGVSARAIARDLRCGTLGMTMSNGSIPTVPVHTLALAGHSRAA